MPSIMAARLRALADLVENIDLQCQSGTVERVDAELGDMDDALYITLHTTRETEMKFVVHDSGRVTPCGGA